MIKYDNTKPLIIIHIPKNAGTSIREIYKKWFNNNLYLHYYHEKTKTPPKKLNLYQLQKTKTKIAIYGHFNKTRNFGIEQYYPEVEQFITILRDPFKRAISAYFYMKTRNNFWNDQSRIPSCDLRYHLLNYKGSMLKHFPCNVTLDNYIEVIETKFIEIGVTDHLDESMTRIADKLGFNFTNGSLKKLNTTKYNQEIPHDLENEFIENHQLEYSIYNYILDKYSI